MKAAVSHEIGGARDRRGSTTAQIGALIDVRLAADVMYLEPPAMARRQT